MSTFDLFQSSVNSLLCQPMADNKEKGDPVFGARLEEAVSYSGKSRRQIALAIGVTAQSAQRWGPYGYLDKKHIPAFCRACGVSVEWLLTGEGDIESPNPLRGATDEEIIEAAVEILSLQGQSALLTQLANLISQARTAEQPT